MAAGCDCISAEPTPCPLSLLCHVSYTCHAVPCCAPPHTHSVCTTSGACSRRRLVWCCLTGGRCLPAGTSATCCGRWGTTLGLIFVGCKAFVCCAWHENCLTCDARHAPVQTPCCSPCCVSKVPLVSLQPAVTYRHVRTPGNACPDLLAEHLLLLLPLLLLCLCSHTWHWSEQQRLGLGFHAKLV